MSNKLANLVDQALIGDPTAKAILRKIADQGNDFGEGCWSGHEYIAQCVEFGRQTVSAKCSWLKDQGLLDWDTRPGNSNLYYVNEDALVEKRNPWFDKHKKDMSVRTTGVSGKPTGDVGDDDTSLKVTTIEPTYIDDVDGVPDELMMEWDTFLKGWAHYFPGKTQPRPGNAKLRNKFKTRMKGTQWRGTWKQAIKTASKLSWTHQEGWFKAEWVLHNDENIFKLLDGTFDFKGGQLPPERVADPVSTNSIWDKRRKPKEE